VRWYQQGKTNLDLLEQEIVIGSGILKKRPLNGSSLVGIMLVKIQAQLNK